MSKSLTMLLLLAATGAAAPSQANAAPCTAGGSLPCGDSAGATAAPAQSSDARASRRAARQARLAAMTPEQRAQRQARRNAMTPEQRAARRAARQSRQQGQTQTPS